jgi:hypothetical protein
MAEDFFILGGGILVEYEPIFDLKNMIVLIKFSPSFIGKNEVLQRSNIFWCRVLSQQPIRRIVLWNWPHSPFISKPALESRQYILGYICPAD